jgi:hypothetical protein
MDLSCDIFKASDIRRLIPSPAYIGSDAPRSARIIEGTLRKLCAFPADFRAFLPPHFAVTSM